MEIAGIGLVTAFVAGVISFLSPCVLPLVPGYVSFVAGQSMEQLQQGEARRRLAALGLSLAFVAGFSTVFIAFGASATYLGRLVAAYRFELNVIGGLVVILFGLMIAGWLPLGGWMREARFHPQAQAGHPLSAYLLGLAFAFGWTPCIGPVLGAILTVSATRSGVEAGVILLAVYSAGLGVPFVLAALFTRRFMGQTRRLGRWGRRLQKGAGAVMILMGLAMVTGTLTRLAWWLLEVFPWLGRIG
ncbi:MAG: cytochrome c biogenesis protein CcdA [Candidatus Competibacteraceae bacterium]|nr:cytochrome c biogenesis protein CcdA [Candidatus Competibacteraceae bacterium]